MKNKTANFTITLFLFLFSYNITFSQVSDQVVMVFSEDASPYDIQQILNEFNLGIIDGPTMNFNAYLLEVIGGNYPPAYANLPSPINGVIITSSGLSKVDGAGLNYTHEFYGDDMGGSGMDNTINNNCSQMLNKYPYSSGPFEVKTSVFDTGILNPYGTSAADFFDIYNPGYNYVDDTHFYSPKDDNDHGSHVSSILIGELNNYLEVYSVSASKTHNRYGYGELWAIMQALDQGISDNINVINMSFSYTESFDHRYEQKAPLSVAINHAKDHGILIVASAGNNNNNNDISQTSAYPASFEHDNIISTASIGCSFNRSSFSNYGATSVDVFATGENIIGWNQKGGYKQISGTSQANAFVSRLATYLGTHQAVFDYEEVKCAILNGVNKLNSNNVREVLSDGYINPESSIDLLLSGQACISTSYGSITTRDQDANDDSIDSTKIKASSNGIEISYNASKNSVGNLLVTDIMGRVIIAQTIQALEGFNSYEVELNNINQKGIYVVQLEVEGEIFVEKFVN